MTRKLSLPIIKGQNLCYKAKLYPSYLGGGNEVDRGSLVEVTLTLPQQVGYSLNKEELIIVLFIFLNWKLFLFGKILLFRA